MKSKSSINMRSQFFFVVRATKNVSLSLLFIKFKMWPKKFHLIYAEIICEVSLHVGEKKNSRRNHCKSFVPTHSGK